MTRSISLLRIVSTLALIALLADHGATTCAGSVFSFGSNGTGRTGLNLSAGNTLIATPIDTSNLAGRAITQVAAGYSHNLLLAEDGSVFSFGWNNAGRTGLNTITGNTLIATPIETTNLGGRAITQVSAGREHSLLLADDGSLFSFGANGAGRTGLNTDTGVTLIATPIDTSSLGGRAITQVSAGSVHSLLLTDDGSVFSFGANGAGRTGLNTDIGVTFIATPIDTSNLGGRAITQVAAGAYHSLLLAEDGSVFSFGWNYYGQLGDGTTTDRLVASPIDASPLEGRAITQVAVGVSHSLLLAEDGSVFSFGWNNAGRTGLNTITGNTLIATPIDTTNLGSLAITQVAAGELHSVLLAEGGNAFTFGANTVGRTGLNTGSDSTLFATPIDMSNLGGLAISQVAAGGFHSLLIAVPEPGSRVLVCLALVGLFGTARRR